MNRALHIFRKDLRRLRLHIGLFVALVVSFAALDIAYVPGPDAALEIPRAAAEILITLAAWWLIATAVHEEPLIGPTAFWITRPYGRGELLLAKALLFVAIILLPLFLSDCLILLAQGLPLFSRIGGLLLRELAFCVWLVLPTFAIAALTRDLTQYALGWFVAAIYAIVIVQLKSDSPLLANDFAWSIIWILAFLSAAIMLAAICLQYRGQRTAWSRALFALALIPPALPVSWDVALAAQNLFLRPAERATRIRITPSQERRSHAAARLSNDVFCVEIPVEVSGLEEGWHLAMVAGSAEFTSDIRRLKRARGDQEAWLRTQEGSYWQNACAGENPGFVPVDAVVTAVFAVLDEQERIPVELRGEPVTVPDVGKCELTRAGDNAPLLCRAAVRPPAAGVARMNAGNSDEAEISYFNHAWAPLHVLPGFSPVFKWICLSEEARRGFRPALGGAFVDLSFTPHRPIAFLKRTYTVPNVVFGIAK